MGRYLSGKSRRKELRKQLRQQMVQEQQKPEQRAEVFKEKTEEATPKKVEKRKFGVLKDLYERRYKTLLIIPFAVLLIALLLIGAKIIMTGDFVNKGITLKGGTTITFENASSINVVDLMGSLKTQFPGFDINVRELSRAGKQIGIIIDSDAEKEGDIDAIVSFVQERLPAEEQGYSIETMGSSLGASFFKETLIALLIAFCFMGIVVFIYFRIFLPSVAVILCAFTDIVVTLTIFNLLGFKLSTAGIAAFLMLIGYSVDTDILLSTKLLKRKEGSLMDRLYSAMKTGFTMSATTLGAIVVALIFTQSEVIRQIMTILLIGLLVDLIFTWIQNAGLLRLYLEKQRTAENE